MELNHELEVHVLDMENNLRLLKDKGIIQDYAPPTIMEIEDDGIYLSYKIVPVGYTDSVSSGDNHEG